MNFLSRVKESWERWLFALVGLVLLGGCFKFLIDERIASASATFAMSFLCFIYSNLARFKRFKGLGFEAELWEDKQREAASLIERLKNVVSIYTSEIILGRVMRGRWGGKAEWQSHWELYDELVKQHGKLGQEIDFSRVKKRLDGIFVFDSTLKLSVSVFEQIRIGKEMARRQIEKQFGNPIVDAAGYGSKQTQLGKIKDRLGDVFEYCDEGNVASMAISIASDSKRELKELFDVDVKYDAGVWERLNKVSELRDAGPITMSLEVLELAGLAQDDE